jgi:hypothetical protein
MHMIEVSQAHVVQPAVRLDMYRLTQRLLVVFAKQAIGSSELQRVPNSDAAQSCHGDSQSVPDGAAKG